LKKAELCVPDFLAHILQIIQRDIPELEQKTKDVLAQFIDI